MHNLHDFTQKKNVLPKFYFLFLYFVFLAFEFSQTPTELKIWFIYLIFLLITTKPVADPGFPVGGVDLIGGGADSQGGYILKILYVEMKESGPLGGVCQACPP